MTRLDKLMTAFNKGRTLKVEQIRTIGYANPYAAISNLRDRYGAPIVKNTTRLKNGTKVTSYSLGG